MQTGTITSCSIVKDLHKFMGISKLPVGLSSSSNAKEGERVFLFNWELSTLNFTSSTKPFAGTPLDGLLMQ